MVLDGADERSGAARAGRGGTRRGAVRRGGRLAAKEGAKGREREGRGARGGGGRCRLVDTQLDVERGEGEVGEGSERRRDWARGRSERARIYRRNGEGDGPDRERDFSFSVRSPRAARKKKRKRRGKGKGPTGAPAAGGWGGGRNGQKRGRGPPRRHEAEGGGPATCPRGKEKKRKKRLFLGWIGPGPGSAWVGRKRAGSVWAGGVRRGRLTVGQHVSLPVPGGRKSERGPTRRGEFARGAAHHVTRFAPLRLRGGGVRTGQGGWCGAKPGVERFGAGEWGPLAGGGSTRRGRYTPVPVPVSRYQLRDFVWVTFDLSKKKNHVTNLDTLTCSYLGFNFMAREQTQNVVPISYQQIKYSLYFNI